MPAHLPYSSTLREQKTPKASRQRQTSHFHRLNANRRTLSLSLTPTPTDEMDDDEQQRREKKLGSDHTQDGTHQSPIAEGSDAARSLAPWGPHDFAGDKQDDRLHADVAQHSLVGEAKASEKLLRCERGHEPKIWLCGHVMASQHPGLGRCLMAAPPPCRGTSLPPPSASLPFLSFVPSNSAHATVKIDVVGLGSMV